MKISNLFNSGKTVFSFEVFPPKKTSPIESVYGKLEEISALKPDFISVTYSRRRQRFKEPYLRNRNKNQERFRS